MGDNDGVDELASAHAAARDDRGDSGASAQVGRAAGGGQLTARRVATLIWALCLVIALATLVLLAIGPGRVLPSDIFSGVGGVSFLVLAMTFASVGALVARRVPENGIGWIFLLTGLANSVQLLTWQYADVGLHATERLPGATAAAVFNTVISEATAGLLGLSLLLFPDGRLPSRRWRPALVSLVVGMALLVLAGTLRPGRYAEPFAQISNPFGLAGAGGVIDGVDFAGWLFVIAGIGLGAAAMVIRLRGARGIERQQLKLVLTVGSVAATAAALLMVTWLVWPTGQLQLRIAVLGLCLSLAALVHIRRSEDTVAGGKLAFWSLLLSVFFGLGVAHDMVDDPSVRSSIQELVTRLLDFLSGHNWIVVIALYAAGFSLFRWLGGLGA